MTRSKKPSVSIAAKVMFFANIVLAGVTFLSFLTPFIHPKYFWVFSIIGLFFPIYMLLHAGFLVYWLFTYRKKIWLSFFCLVFGFQHIQNYVGFHSNEMLIDEEKTFQMATFNISYGYFQIEKNKVSKKENTLLLGEKLEALKEVDIICFQEVGDYVYNILKKSFPKHKSYRIEKGVVIFSKFPIGNKGSIEFGTFTNSCIWADVTIKGEKVRIYNFHLQSNKVSKDADGIVENLQKNENVKWYKDIKGILRKYKNTNISRSRQIDKVVNHMEQCPYPFLVGTDMNDVPVSYIYRQISKISSDAFRERGKGLGTTYAGNIPLLRIDYLFYSNTFRCLQYKTPTTNISDHYPVVATLSHHFEN